MCSVCRYEELDCKDEDRGLTALMWACKEGYYLVQLTTTLCLAFSSTNYYVCVGRALRVRSPPRVANANVLLMCC